MSELVTTPKMSFHVRTAILLFLASSMVGCGSKQSADQKTDSLKAPVADATDSAIGKAFGVTIRKPAGPPRVTLGVNDFSGEPITASCTTCHATRPPNEANKVSSDLDEFHQGLPLSHGTTACLSCHNRDDYDSLRLSSGERVEFTEVMTLCAQCHGTQMRDYQNGAHGGMNGHWDLDRGPRTRNNCVDCHDPHSPRFPHMVPTFKPIDRFLNDSSHDSKDSHD